MQNILKLAGLAALTSLCSVAVAEAAQATASVNVRSGPGTGYGVVDTLYVGESVSVEECGSSGWCLIEHSGPDGWVSARYLTGERDEGNDRVVVRSSPSVSLSFSFGRGNGYSIGNAPRGSTRDLVCLVTFHNRGQVAGGADADVQRAQLMSRQQAEQIDRPNDRRAIFDYGTNRQTRDTCEYLDNLN
ncbi:MAG: SH3 domain-containing protein [Devosia sp.]